MICLFREIRDLITCLCISALLCTATDAAWAQSKNGRAYRFPKILNDTSLSSDSHLLRFGDHLLIISGDGKMIFFKEGSGFSQITVPTPEVAAKIAVFATAQDKDDNVYLIGKYSTLGKPDKGVHFVLKYDLQRQTNFISLPEDILLAGSIAVLGDGSIVLGTLDAVDPLTGLDGALIRISGDLTQVIAGTGTDNSLEGNWHEGVSNGEEVLFASFRRGAVIKVGADLSVQSYSFSSIRSIGVDAEGRFWYVEARDNLPDDTVNYGYLTSEGDWRKFKVPGLFTAPASLKVGSHNDLWHFDEDDNTLRVGINEQAIYGKFLVPSGKIQGPVASLIRTTIGPNSQFWALCRDTPDRYMFLQKFGKTPIGIKIQVQPLGTKSGGTEFRVSTKIFNGYFDYFHYWASFNVMIFGSKDNKFDLNDTLVREERVDFSPLSPSSKGNLFTLKSPKNYPHAFACIDCNAAQPLSEQLKKIHRLH